MSKKILFLVEGKKAEYDAIKTIAKNMFNLIDENYEVYSYNPSIYELYDELNRDSDLDLIGLLIEKRLISLSYNETRNDIFSQIYLVFDFEPHYQKYSDDKIIELLNFFNEETENGKLYINYPMFEAAFYIDDYKHPKYFFKCIEIENCKGSIFKKEVKRITCLINGKKHIDWTFSKKENLLCSVKWNFEIQKKLTNKDDNREIDYGLILEKEIEMKNKYNKIIVLSTFVLIIFDFKPDIVKELLIN